MSPAEKERHRLDQKADNKWTNDKRRKGWTEDQIATAFAIRLEERAARRATSLEGPATTIENVPGYGVF